MYSNGMYGRKIQNSSFFFPGVVNLERPLERLQEPDENGNPGPFVNKTKCRKERKKTFLSKTLTFESRRKGPRVQTRVC